MEEIGRALSSELDPEMVLGKVVEAALEILEVDGAAVWLAGGKPGPVYRVAASGGDIRLPKGLEWDIRGDLERVLVQERRPVTLDNIAMSNVIPPSLREHLSGGSAIGAPMEAEGRVIGVLTAGSREVRKFDALDTGVLQRLARQGSVALRGRSLAIAVFDLDNFKHYNDTFGHVAGDDILKAFAEVLNYENRAMNLVARFGGDEFVSVLTDTNREGIRAYVERVKARAATQETLAKFGIHVSAGTAEFDPNQMATVNDLLRSADTDMYRDKASRPAVGRRATAH
jgi:diguanylate cyclase (GGDEF)-like protein